MNAETDIAGKFALQRLEVAYMVGRCNDLPENELTEIREAICICRGWEFKP